MEVSQNRVYCFFGLYANSSTLFGVEECHLKPKAGTFLIGSPENDDNARDFEKTRILKQMFFSIRTI